MKEPKITTKIVFKFDDFDDAEFEGINLKIDSKNKKISDIKVIKKIKNDGTTKLF